MEGGSAFRWNVIRLVLKTFIKRKMNILSFYCYEARVLNGSWQPANFAGYFTWTRHLLFFGNYPQKSQNLMMSVFCSNALICVPECWKCTLRGPDFKIFPRGISWTHWKLLAFASRTCCASFFLLYLLHSFFHPLKTLLKTTWSCTWTLELEGNFNELNLHCLYM